MDETTLQVFLTFFRLGLLAWGGGQAILAEMQRETTGNGWLTDQQFLEAYAIGQMSPGPGTLYVVPMGYQAAGVPGAFAATVGFFLPTITIGLGLILIWHRLRESRWPSAIRDALLPVGVGLVLASVVTIGRAALTDLTGVAIAFGSALIFWRTSLPPTLVVLTAGALGALGVLLLAR
jgi:chromate transporter